MTKLDIFIICRPLVSVSIKRNGQRDLLRRPSSRPPGLGFGESKFGWSVERSAHATAWTENGIGREFFVTCRGIETDFIADVRSVIAKLLQIPLELDVGAGDGSG
jgi:hypothetical protein